MAILELKDISYSYEQGKPVLKKVNMLFESGKMYAILGNSGAGKTTLLSLLAGLDEASEGQILLNGKDIKAIGYDEYRRNHVSLIFQNYNLIDYMTPLENIKLVNKKASAQLLFDMGLDQEQINRNVLKLSGGQQQRVAIARALVSKTEMILADEPSGNLDENTTQDIIEILQKAAYEEGKCVIVVTHSQQMAKAADQIVYLKKGILM